MYSPGELAANRCTVDFASSKLSAAAFPKAGSILRFDEYIQWFDHGGWDLFSGTTNLYHDMAARRLERSNPAGMTPHDLEMGLKIHRDKSSASN